MKTSGSNEQPINTSSKLGDVFSKQDLRIAELRDIQARHAALFKSNGALVTALVTADTEGITLCDDHPFWACAYMEPAGQTAADGTPATMRGGIQLRVVAYGAMRDRRMNISVTAFEETNDMLEPQNSFTLDEAESIREALAELLLEQLVHGDLRPDLTDIDPSLAHRL